MAIGCSGQLIKVLLIILNIIVSLAGLGLVVIGIFFLVDDRAVHYLGVASDDDTGMIRSAAITVLVVGFISLAIGVLGCWGATRHYGAILFIYAVIIVLIILLEIVGAILAGVFHAKIASTLKDNMNKTVQSDYGKADEDTVTKAWDSLQYSFSCCGVNGPLDWQTSYWKHHGNHSVDATVPLTCCVLKNGDWKNPQPKNESVCYGQAVQSNSTSEDYVHHKGCEKSLEDWITGHVYILIGIVIGVILIEVLVVALSCILRARIGRGYEYV